MLSKTNDVGAPLIITGSSVLTGSVVHDVIVQKHGSLHLCGSLKGNLTIEQAASVVVEGFVDGKVINKGGRLVVNGNEGFAEFVTRDGSPEVEAGGVLRVNLSAIALNWGTLAKLTLGECAAAVMANAYGCGLDVVAAALAKTGCRTFFVSDLSEARRVRKAAPKSVIYVLSGLSPGTGPIFAEIGAQPIVSSHIEMAEWDTFVAASQWTGGFALYVSTGTDRLGMPFEEAAAFAPRVHSTSSGITLLMSDLDTPNKPDQRASDRQIEQFKELRRLYPGIPASILDSSGIVSCPHAQFDLVRTGALLYGVNPTPGVSNPMLPVIDLRARIVQVRDLARGETIAGSDGWAAKRRSRLAVVSVGYADGYPRPENGAENKLEAIVGGHRCPIAGRASMDLLPIDITDLPDPRAARRGEMVTLIGAGISIDDLAAAAQSTASELLVNLGSRFHRIYHAG
jgi:alanine racemase